MKRKTIERNYFIPSPDETSSFSPQVFDLEQGIVTDFVEVLRVEHTEDYSLDNLLKNGANITLDTNPSSAPSPEFINSFANDLDKLNENNG